MHRHFGVAFSEELLAASVLVPLAVHVARVGALLLRFIVDLELVQLALAARAEVGIGIVVVLLLLHDRGDVHDLYR